jgi:HrpA-like RNA helicase
MDHKVTSVRNTPSLTVVRILEQRRLSRAIREQRLPICDHKDEIIQHIEKHRVTCIHGETGCGKSTMVPLFITENFYTEE